MAATDDSKLYIIFNFFEKACEDEPFRSGMLKVAQHLKEGGTFIEGLFMKPVPVGDENPYVFMNYGMFNTSDSVVFHTDKDPRFFKKLDEIFQGQQKQFKSCPDGFNELFHYPPSPAPSKTKRPADCGQTGYFITAIEPVEDAKAFEEQWMAISGADFIKANIPPELGFRRMTLHKRFTEFGRYQYVLLTECSQAMKEHQDVAKEFVAKIRGNKPEFFSGLFFAWLPYL